ADVGPVLPAVGGAKDVAAAESAAHRIDDLAVGRIDEQALDRAVGSRDIPLRPARAVVRGDENVTAGAGVNCVAVAGGDGNGVDVGLGGPTVGIGSADWRPIVRPVRGLVDAVGAEQQA